MLEVKNIDYFYKKNGFHIEDVSLKLKKGYVTVLLGENGAGKTTLLRMIYKMYSPKKGEIFWKGEKVTNRNLHLYRREAAYIEDGNWCMNWGTVKENIELLQEVYDHFDEAEFYANLQKFDFDEGLMAQKYSGLSKGEQMKLQLAFVLARRPQYILLDEPFANLDPVVKTDLIVVLHQKVMNNEMGILLSTHLLEDVTDIADYIGVMEAGKIRAFGDREKILSQYQAEDLCGIFSRL